MSATRKTGPVLFSDTINSEVPWKNSQASVGNVSEEVREYEFFQQTVQLPIELVIQTLS
jgi:hypothetical protein